MAGRGSVCGVPRMTSTLRWKPWHSTDCLHDYETTIMKRRKVLFITAWYPLPNNPVFGTFVKEHAKAVQRFDDVVVLHCVGRDQHLPGLWRMEQEAAPTLTEGIPTYRLWERAFPMLQASYVVRLWSVLRAVHCIAEQGFRPDIIHAHVYSVGVAAAVTSKVRRIPLVITEHTSEFPRKIIPRLRIWGARFAFRQAQLVMPVSHRLQQAMEEYGVKARFQVVPNVVDTSLFAPRVDASGPKQGTEILFVGRLDSEHLKGIPYLLGALAQLKQARQDWRLHIVGDGPVRCEYEQMAKDFGLAPHVTFHGMKARHEVAAFMQRADLFVLPSLWENLPCVLIEAMACGLPILSTRVGGIPEMVDDETGVLVTPGNEAALLQGLTHMLDSLDRYDRRAISRKAQRYSYEAVGRSLHAIYEECLRS
ncbi:MAG: glycosyltransferase family 4 protein [Nitrospirae bacterium]|nr:MAG: glycosyltransferase family 4 protein [Nitrospirota bacterium]